MLNRRNALRLIAAAPVLALVIGPAVPQSARRWTIGGERVEKLDALDAIMQRLLQQQGIRAGALAIARRGEVLFERAYTWAEAGYPAATPLTPFRLASVSKAFTAALIHALSQTRALRLDTPVFPYLEIDRPVLPDQAMDARLPGVTVQHLLDHRGGWDRRIARFDPVFKMRPIARKLGLDAAPVKRDIARFVAGEPLQFNPGDQTQYSNFGYLLLGLVAEKAGGKAFMDLVNDRVTGPLGIAGAFLARTDKTMRLPAEGVYDQPGSGLSPEFPNRDVWVPLPYGGEGWLTESMDSTGGVTATAGAVARMIGHYAVWGLGRRRAGKWVRTGSMAGTLSCATSRADLVDWCLVVNTRKLERGAFAAAIAQIDGALDGVLRT